VIGRRDGLAVALAQPRDRDGRLAACMGVVPVHGNVSTLLVILKAVVAALFRSRLTRLSAGTALRFTASRTSHVCMANASFTAVSKDMSPLPTVIAASGSTLNSMMRRTYRRVPTGSNTFPSGGTERSCKIYPFPALSVNPLYNSLDTIWADFIRL